MRATHAALVALYASAWLVPREARAYHDRATQPTDGTGYTLKQRELRLGVSSVSYGAHDRVMLGTRPLPFLLSYLWNDATLLNGFCKLGVLVAPPVAASLEMQAYYLRFSDPTAATTGISAWVFPFTAAVSWRHDAALTSSAGVTWVDSISDVDAAAAQVDVQGAALFSNLQMNAAGLEVPLQVSDGTVVAWIDVKGNVGIRDRNTSWSCDAQALTCTTGR